MEYSIQKLAELASVTTRTLRYYDQIGLLRPQRRPSGYRVYTAQEVDTLQQILFYRELGVALGEIKKILEAPDYDPLQALEDHLKKLEEKRLRINALVENVEKSIQREKGKRMMTDGEKFEGFKKGLIDKNEEAYGAEIRQKYGDAQVDESNAKLLNLSNLDYAELERIGNQLITDLEQAVARGEDPKGEAGQAIAHLHRRWLHFSWPRYSPQSHAGLAQMYVDDERFTEYYDKRVEGCARFLRDAVEEYARKQQG